MLRFDVTAKILKNFGFSSLKWNKHFQFCRPCVSDLVNGVIPMWTKLPKHSHAQSPSRDRDPRTATGRRATAADAHALAAAGAGRPVQQHVSRATPSTSVQVQRPGRPPRAFFRPASTARGRHTHTRGDNEHCSVRRGHGQSSDLATAATRRAAPAFAAACLRACACVHHCRPCRTVPCPPPPASPLHSLTRVPLPPPPARPAAPRRDAKGDGCAPPTAVPPLRRASRRRPPARWVSPLSTLQSPRAQTARLRVMGERRSEPGLYRATGLVLYCYWGGYSVRQISRVLS